MSTNQILKSFLELIGDKVSGGYSLTIDDQEIPIRLNKDFKAEYPEIRVAPNIYKKDSLYDKYIEDQYREYKHWQSSTNQIDIYSNSVILNQKIYDTIVNRLYDFFNLETLIYDYTPFEPVDVELYRNKAYALLEDQMFKDIYSVYIGDLKFTKARSFDQIQNNGFYVNDEYLYVKTNQNIEDIKIKVLLQGRLFENGDSHSDRGIHVYNLSKQRNLSNLETNQVERISFDVNILYSRRRQREKIPNVNMVNIRKLRKR